MSRAVLVSVLLVLGCVPRAKPIATAPTPAPAARHSEPAPSASRTPDAAPTPIDISRETLLGTDRVKATSAVEAISLAGGKGALPLIADYQERRKGDREMVRHGQAALARLSIETSAVVDVLANDPDAGHRAWAAWTAGAHDLSAASEGLRAALDDADPMVRSRAMWSLARIGDTRSQDRLLKIAVHDPNLDTRERATEALDLLNKPRPPKLPVAPAIAKLASNDPFDRLDGLRTLEKAADARGVPPILKLLEDERDVEVRKTALGALSSIGDDIVVPVVVRIALAKAESREVREFAVAALATLDDSRAVGPLADLARDPLPSIRRFSLRALARLKREGAESVMEAALVDPVPEVRSEALIGVAKLVDRGAADILAARISKEPEAEIRQAACAALGTLGTVGSTAHESVLITALDDSDPGVRLAAIGALAKLGTRRAQKPLERIVDQEKKKKENERDAQLLRLAEDAAAQVRAR